MKKLILLALVALVAGAAFAETAPAFSGEFVFSTQMDFGDEYFAIDDGDGSASINLNGVVDEWSTVNAELSADSDAAVELNAFNLTTDITGALGVDGPVGASITWGALTMQAAEYQKVAGYEDRGVALETATYLGFSMTFTIVEKVQFITLVAPATYFGGTWLRANEAAPTNTPAEPVFGFELRFLGLVDGLDANVFFVSDENPGGSNDEPFQQIGMTAGYVMGDLSMGAAFDYRLDTEDGEIGVSVQYILGQLTAGVAAAMNSFNNIDGSNIGVGINLTYALTDALSVFGAAQMPFADISDNFGFDAGVEVMLGATTYTLGYEYRNSHFKAPDNDFDSVVEDGAMDGLFFKVSASF